MKSLYYTTIAIVMLQTCLILTFHSASAQTIPTIKPGFLPDCMGQSFRQNESFDIVNSTGFLGMHYLYYGHILVYDYILKPGQNATMIYAEHGGSSSDIAGDFQFFHGNNDGSHSGVSIEQTTINATDNSAYSKITILSDQDVGQGTYWLIFPPGLCSGGSVILFTIGDSLDLVPQIGTLKAHIENHETDDVIVINSSPYMLANLTLLDPAGKVERAYEIMVDPNGNSARWFTPTQNGNYVAAITSATGNMTIPFTVSGVEQSPQRVGNSVNLYDSPLKQMGSGTSTQNIVCSSGLELVYKSTNNYPACVTQQTGKNLIKRGWGTVQPANYLINISGVLVHYNITGGNIQGAKLDMQYQSLTFSFNMINSGMLNVTLPRALVDAKCTERCILPHGTDIPFAILNDHGQQAYFTEIGTTPINRTLSIQIPRGLEQIEIAHIQPV